MSDPCKQEPLIRIMDARQAAMSATLERVAEAMDSIVAQRVEIAHLVEQNRDGRKWMKQHEDRLQALEKAPGNAAGRFLWLVIGTSVTIVPGIVTGLVLFYTQRGPTP